MRSCKNCGAPLSAGLVCPACGTRNIPGSSPTSPTARPAAPQRPPASAAPSAPPPPPAAQPAPMPQQPAPMPQQPAPITPAKASGGLKAALITLNCVLAVAVAGLSAVTILARREPAPVQAPSGGNSSPSASGGGNGSGAILTPAVSGNVFVSFSPRSRNSSYTAGADTYFAFSNTRVHRFSPGMAEMETIFNFELVDPTNARFIGMAHNVNDAAPIGDTLYMNLWSLMNRMPCHIVAAPLSGGEMELLFTLPTNTVMTVSDGLLYCIWERNLIVYNPAKGGEPAVYQLEAPINPYYNFFVVDGAVYYNGGYTDEGNYGLRRYVPETGVTEGLASGYQTLGMGPGVLVDGIYYYSDDDEMGVQYLVAHDIAAGASTVLDVRMDAELMGMTDSFTGYHDGGIYYAANENGEYNRYDIATGEITFAYTVERTVPTDAAFADSGPVTLRGEAAGYFTSREGALIDPATGLAVAERGYNETNNAGVGYERFLSQYETAKSAYEDGTLYIPGGKVLPLTTEKGG